MYDHIFVTRLERNGAFMRIALNFIRISRGSPARLLTLIILASTLSAMILMNDISLSIYVPIIAAMSKTSNIDLPLFSTILSISVNVGSALTPIGNSQNIIIWQYYGVGFVNFVRVMMLFFVISIILLFLIRILC